MLSAAIASKCVCRWERVKTAKKIPLSGDHIGPNAIPFVFRIRKWCDFLNCPNVPPNVFSPMYHRMLSVCFPNVFSMVSECFQNRPNTSRMLISKCFFPNAFRMLSECFQNTANRPRMDLTISACILKVFGKHTLHTVYSGRVRAVRNMF